MAALYKRDRSPFWWIKYYPAPGARVVRKATGIRHEGKRKPSPEALKFRAEIEQRQGRARNGLASSSPEIVTVGKFLTDYVDKMQVTELSRERYHLHVRKFILWAGENGIHTMDQIDSVSAMKFEDHLKTLALAQPGPIVSVLRRALDNARARNVASWSVNPFNEVKVKAVPTGKDKERGAFTREQITTILAITDPPWLKRLTMLGLMTGARISSVRIVRWEDINFDFGRIHFRFAKRADGRDKSYVQPLHDELRDYLLSIKPEPATGPLFPDAQAAGEGELAENTATKALSTAYARAIHAAGVAGSFHWLRHTYNTWLAAQGMNQAARMKLSNHESESVNKHYTHQEEAMLKSELAKVKFLKEAV